MTRLSWIHLAVVFGVALFGIALLFNPFYLYPDGGGFERTYYVTQIENEDTATHALIRSRSVLDCPGGRPCAFEENVLEEGSVTYDTRVFDSPRWYAVVRVEAETYLPVEQFDGNATVVTLEPISSLEAVEHVAVPVEERSDEVREAIESGSVTVYGERVEAFDHEEIIEHGGEYYYRTTYQSKPHWTDDNALLVVRALLFLLGSGLIAYSGWRFRMVKN